MFKVLFGLFFFFVFGLYFLVLVCDFVLLIFYFNYDCNYGDWDGGGGVGVMGECKWYFRFLWIFKIFGLLLKGCDGVWFCWICYV